ncbi:hypothetical protein COV82_05130 [Candidatus Peregrinibacteria bacterium CG11_big_fil_rev_8_21_14_0_20_46_8]|nr:MAG: hypothetical protein COV82_05130 [Candidatus Peregrinibacteria bacterium CG11_big_fil_rev_8_21_14_0_20_46_8]
MSKTYLITGGAGFIGSHIAAALIARGDNVRILDDLSTGKEEYLPDGAELAVAKITDDDDLAATCRNADGIFHTAAIANLQYSITNPVETHEVNCTGTVKLLVAAREAGVKRVIYSSSCAVYGEPESLPLRETMHTKPTSPYGLQKLMSEGYMELAAELWNIETVNLRYANVFGPRLVMNGAYASVIATFLQQHAAGLPLTITGDGTQTRDFIYVDDVVAANLAAMDSAKVGNGEQINIGTGQATSVNEVAKQFGGATKNIAARKEVHDATTDISLAKSLLNWEPQTKFQEGLQKTIAWYAEQA